MARLASCNTGYETGDPAEAGTTVTGGDGSPTVTVVSSTPSPATGVYSLKCTLNNAYGTGAKTAVKTFALTAGQSAGYFRCRIYSAEAYVVDIMSFKDDAGAVQLTLTWSNVDGLLRLYRGSRAGTLLATSSGAIGTTTWTLLRGYVLIDGTTGRFTLYSGATAIIDFTGNTRAGTAYVATWVIGNYSIGADHTDNRYVAYDDICWNDPTGARDTGLPNGGGSVMLKPTGDGDLSQLTNDAGNSTSNYTHVDEAPPNTTDYVAGGTADLEDDYALADLPAGYNVITHVMPVAYAALASAGTGGLRTCLRIASTSYPDAADRNLGTTYGYVQGDLRYVDPSDSAAWTVAKVNTLQAGPRAR